MSHVPRKWSNKIASKVNMLANIIRKEKTVTRGRLMVLANMGSSTLYAYEKPLLEYCKDIKRVGNEFRCVPEEK